MNIARTIDHEIYSRKAISDARAAYKDYCHVHVEPLLGNCARLTITVLPTLEDDSREIALNFLNYALDKSAEIHLQGG